MNCPHLHYVVLNYFVHLIHYPHFVDLVWIDLFVSVLLAAFQSMYWHLMHLKLNLHPNFVQSLDSHFAFLAL
ncbi:hypothetical protein D3C75_1151220 [compost metagenome]